MTETINYSFEKQDFGHPVRDNELGDNLDLIDSAIKAREHTKGTSNFAGSGGVTITHNLDLSDYTPSIVPTADAAGDTVSVRKYNLAGLEEWATIKRERAMQAKAGSLFGADGYPKGNNDYGEDHNDADEWRFYGDNDPTHTAAGHEIYKVLCGSGPDSWYHDNNRKTGIWCYNGNVNDWLKAKVYDRKIQAGYPGEGFTFPNANNYIATIEAAAVLCGAKDLALPITQAGIGVTEFGDDYAYLAYAGDKAFRVGGHYSYTSRAGVSAVHIGSTPDDAGVHVGFRAAL
jgi:hypothetical protein